MKPYSIRLPQGLLELAEIKSRTERIHTSAALRQLIYAGAERYVLRLISEGSMSVGRGAELLEVTVHDIQRLTREQGIDLGATGEQYRKAREAAGKLE